MPSGYSIHPQLLAKTDTHTAQHANAVTVYLCVRAPVTVFSAVPTVGFTSALATHTSTMP